MQKDLPPIAGNELSYSKNSVRELRPMLIEYRIDQN